MTTLTVGNRRLLKLADILSKADATHKKKSEPNYDQQFYAHECGTPACALGHWATANRRWVWLGLKYDLFPRLRNNSHGSTTEDAMEEFHLTEDEADELFEVDGCGNAQTAKEAARYIRAFVKRRQRV